MTMKTCTRELHMRELQLFGVLHSSGVLLFKYLSRLCSSNRLSMLVDAFSFYLKFLKQDPPCGKACFNLFMVHAMLWRWDDDNLTGF